MRYERNLSANYAAYYFGNMIGSATLSENDSGSGACFGAGVGFDVSKNFNVNVMFNGYAYSNFESENVYEDGDISTASTTTLGVEVLLSLTTGHGIPAPFNALGLRSTFPPCADRPSD